VIVIIMLRVFSIVSLVVGLAATAASVDDPTKTWIDALSRLMIWIIVSLVCCAQANVCQRVEDSK
jgi:hypothetical protein